MASSDVNKPESKDATSSEVTSEEFQLEQTTTAAIYVLDKTLDHCAVELKEFLTHCCEIKNVCREYHWREHIGDNIAETYANFNNNCEHTKSLDLHTYKDDISTDVTIRDYGYLERLITEAGGGWGLHHDVIILLGHSSVLLAEDKDLIETFAKLNPTIIAFIGCCGGNTRYGPILTMSYLLRNTSEYLWEIPSPIIGFYQRQIYTDELKQTSLIIGLQYYLNIRYSDEMGRLRGTDIARCAFALAKLNKSVLHTDPTVFINDREGKNPVQMILHKCGLTTEAVPLSCMQLVMYSPMVVSSKEFESFTIEDEWVEHYDWPEVDRRITLPKESSHEHKQVINVLWQLDPLKITIHGATQKIKIVQSMYIEGEIKISGALPTGITISEGRTPQSNVKRNKLQGINITSPHNSKISYKDESTHKMTITLAAGRGEFEVIKADHDIDEMLIKLSPELYQRTYMCRRTVTTPDVQEIKFISQDLRITIDELSSVCCEKIEELQLHKIIPLVCEIKFIKLFKYTLELLRKGDKSSWEKIDPLQFLVAVLRGHWGKNSLTDIIEIWATYYLKKSMSNVKNGNPEALHQYKLCCMCFVLLFEDSFVRFVEDEKDYCQYDIIVCTKEEKYKLNDVIKTDDSHQSLPESPINTPFPSDEDLLSCWVDLLQHCQPISQCVDLFNKDDHPEWVIGNGYGPQFEQQENTYNYKYAEFLLAMGALSDECQKTEEPLRKICYHVSEFENKDVEKKGHMKCFSDVPEEMDKTLVEELVAVGSTCKELSFIETRLLLDCSKKNKKLDKKLSKEDLINKLLDLYKKDPAMWRLPDVPTLDQANEEALDQAINNIERITLDETAKDILDKAIKTIRSCLHQAHATLSIQRSLCQAIYNCTDEIWHKVSSCRFVFAQS